MVEQLKDYLESNQIQGVKSLSKIRPGSLYKGHRSYTHLIESESDGISMQITNTWFGTTVQQELFFKVPKLIVTVSIDLFSNTHPKYLSSFIKKGIDLYPSDNFSEFHFTDNKLGLNMDGNIYHKLFNSISCRYELNKHTLLATGETLELSKLMRTHLRIFKSVIKEKQDDDDFIRNVFIRKSDTELNLAHSLFC